MAEIQLANITKKWGEFVGVDDFNLTIADKEFLVLLGPSGCGKTTTMRMIAGLEEASNGDILIDGNRVNDIDPKDRDVSMVFQSYALYPNMNVYENIRFPLKVRGVDPKTHDKRVKKASEMVELDGFMDRKPAELSGGQRQRVALARAIVREPNVFLMDEPLSNLDAKLRVSTRAQIKNLSHELEVTTVYVTHDQIEAMTLADRVVVMEKGVIQQVGSPTEIYDRPENVFVAGFIGNPAMNLVSKGKLQIMFLKQNILKSKISMCPTEMLHSGFEPKMLALMIQATMEESKHQYMLSKCSEMQLWSQSESKGHSLVSKQTKHSKLILERLSKFLYKIINAIRSILKMEKG